MQHLSGPPQVGVSPGVGHPCSPVAVQSPDLAGLEQQLGKGRVPPRLGLTWAVAAAGFLEVALGRQTLCLPHHVPGMRQCAHAQGAQPRPRGTVNSSRGQQAADAFIGSASSC